MTIVFLVFIGIILFSMMYLENKMKIDKMEFELTNMKESRDFYYKLSKTYKQDMKKVKREYTRVYEALEELQQGEKNED